jgi:hypothetical protein
MEFVHVKGTDSKNNHIRMIYNMDNRLTPFIVSALIELLCNNGTFKGIEIHKTQKDGCATVNH